MIFIIYSSSNEIRPISHNRGKTMAFFQNSGSWLSDSLIKALWWLRTIFYMSRVHRLYLDMFGHEAKITE